ncbi:MAG: hypothetical protein JWP52_3985 [Rhizobacter sp.]|nr:hypothetical protein [Rhizobacter sp.]
MKFKFLLGLTAVLAALSSVPALAEVRITEVAPWSSGNSPIGADWFELTNTGASAVSLSGWKMDDDSNSFSKAVSLNGITSIAAGESVIFIESDSSSVNTAFLSNWFSTTAPGLQIGDYEGSGVGLSTGGDQVNIFNASGVKQAGVSFGASPSGPVFATFDNAAGLNNAALSQFSVAGTNGAFAAAGDLAEVGSPGFITAAVPEPETYALMLAGLGLVGAIARKRQR